MADEPEVPDVADVPVLVVAFNRPDKTGLVLDAVRRAAPRRLYLAADGPRPGVRTDAERCERTRRVLEQVDWPCEVRTLYQPVNLGCKGAVEAAIGWFLGCEESGIVLEDDCVPTGDFFPFCAELLDRYRDSPEVMMIGGHNALGQWDENGASYVFSRSAPFWGWATWRRAWDRYDPAMARWPEPDARARVRSSLPAPGYRVTARRFDRVFEGSLDSWGFAWTFAILVHGGVSITPARNLVDNIGFDGEATHTRRPWARAATVPTFALGAPLLHPRTTRPDPAFERVLFQNHFPPSRRLVAMLPASAQDRVRSAAGAIYRLAALARPRPRPSSDPRPEIPETKGVADHGLPSSR